MPRTYAVRPDESRGERFLDARAVDRVDLLLGDWTRVGNVVRVAFDGDVDSGPATVTALVTVAGGPVPSPDGSPATATFRHHARVVLAGNRYGAAAESVGVSVKSSSSIL